MANTYSEARKTIRNLANLMKGLTDLDADLAAVGTIQNAMKVATADLESLEARKAAAGDDLVKARTRAAEILTKASDDAAKIIGNANSIKLNAEVSHELAAIATSDARGVAESIISEAKVQADKIVAGQTGQLAAVNKELMDLATKRDDLTAQIKVLEVKHANATQALVSLQAKLAA